MKVDITVDHSETQLIRCIYRLVTVPLLLGFSFIVSDLCKCQLKLLLLDVFLG